MGDADVSDLSTNLGTLVTGSLNAAYSEAGITDTSSISTMQVPLVAACLSLLLKWMLKQYSMVNLEH